MTQVDMDLPRPLAGGRTPDQKGLDRQRPGAIARVPARRVEKQIFAIFETEERQRDQIVAPRLAPEQERSMALQLGGASCSARVRQSVSIAVGDASLKHNK